MIRKGANKNSRSTLAAKSLTNPKSRLKLTCTLLILGGIFKSPREFLCGADAVTEAATETSGTAVDRPNDTD
jgi:hypothetical protein